MPLEPFSVRAPDGATLSGMRRVRPGAPVVVLLHAGVADSRSWSGVAEELDGDDLTLVAYDRRGYGGTAAGEGFTHLADLGAVLDAVLPAGERAVLVGNSMGGALALDLALTAPDRASRLLLIGSGPSGMTDEGEAIEWTADPDTGALLAALERAEQAGDVEEQVRLELHLWLDGPAMPEGRVGGAARELAADMNRRILTAGTQGSTGDAGLDAWHRLGEIGTPVLATWGEHDVPPDVPFSRLMVERLQDAEELVLPGVAHLPALERPALVADLVRETVASSGRR